MNIEEGRNYCLSKPFVTEDFPFDKNILVFRLANKIFCLTALDALPYRINLKCDPNYAIELREEFSAITPGFHMNKKHWNTVCPEELDNDALLLSLIDHSYNCVLNGLPKKVRVQLK